MENTIKKRRPHAKEVEEYYDDKYHLELIKMIWDGENNHIGIYKTPRTSPKTAMPHTTERMLRLGPKLKKKSSVLDIGSGLGGTVRFIAEKYGSKITAVNLSEVENEIHQTMNKESELDEKVTITHANMELLPFPRETFDLVLSQDSLYHSARKKKVFLEVARVLNPEGRFLFTDIMEGENATDKKLEKLFKDFCIKDLSTEKRYNRMARKSDMEKVYHREMTEELITHYSKMVKAIEKNKAKLEKKTTKKFVKETLSRYNSWVQAAEDGVISWGIMQYQKRNNWA